MPKVRRPNRQRNDCAGRQRALEQRARGGEEAYAFAFAVLVARDDRAMVYGPDNGETHGWHPVLEAAAIAEASPGRAFFVNVASDVLAVDSDKPELASAVDLLFSDLRELGLLPVLLDSGGGPGRTHLFARVADRMLREQLRDRAKALGLDPRPTIRPPLSPHRHGGRSRLLDPVNPLDALVVLAPAARPPRRLRGRMRRIAFEGDGADRSRTGAATVLALVARGRSLESVHDFMLDPRHKSGAKIQKLAAPELRYRHVERLYRSAHKKLAQSPPRRSRPEVDAALAAALTELDADPIWQRPRGSTLYVAARMCLAIAWSCGSLTLHFGCRYLAEQLGVAWSTANSYCHQLAHLGVVRLLRPRGGRWPHTWQLCQPLGRSADGCPDPIITAEGPMSVSSCAHVTTPPSPLRGRARCGGEVC